MSTPHPKRVFSILKSDGAALGLLVIAFFGANWPLLANDVSERWDGEDFFAPFYNYVASLARGGHLLWWNPYCNGGSPDFAEPQVGAFSPVTLLFGLLAGPGPTGFHLYWLCVWLFGGLGMYVLARALSAPPWGALVTSLALVLSGFYIGHAEHLSAVYTFSFVPWILWRLRASLISARLWPACEAGALWGLSALAGNPAVHIPAAMFLALAALAWVPPPAPGASRWQPWRAYLLAMTLLAVVGVIVLAPSYLSFRYEAAGYSHRAQPLPRAEVLSKKFGWAWLTALFVPVPVSIGAPMPDWSEFDISMRQLYIGAAVPVLAAFALWRRGGWRNWLLFGVGLGCLGLAMGSLLPFRAWLYDLAPPTRYFRNAAMFRGFFLLALAMLAAPATGLIETYRRSSQANASSQLRALTVVAVLAAIVAATAYFWLESTLTDEILAQVPATAALHFGIAWIGLLVICAAAEFKNGIRRFLPSMLVALTCIDLAGAYALTGEVAHQPGPSDPFGDLTSPPVELGPAGFSRRLYSDHNANIFTRETMFASYAAMENPEQAKWASDRWLRPFALGKQRLWFTASAPTVSASPEAFKAFERRVHELKGLPIVRQERASLLSPAADLPPADRAAIATAPAAQRMDYQLIAYQANDLALRVTCPADGFLLLTDRWSRSWHATVNGQPVAVDGGDFLFRLVPVKAGENLVVMQYRLSWLYPLLFLSWGTLALVGGVGLWRRYRRERFSLLGALGIRPATIKTGTPVAA